MQLQDIEGNQGKQLLKFLSVTQMAGKKRDGESLVRNPCPQPFQKLRIVPETRFGNIAVDLDLGGLFSPENLCKSFRESLLRMKRFLPGPAIVSAVSAVSGVSAAAISGIFPGSFFRELFPPDFRIQPEHGNAPYGGGSTQKTSSLIFAEFSAQSVDLPVRRAGGQDLIRSGVPFPVPEIDRAFFRSGERVHWEKNNGRSGKTCGKAHEEFPLLPTEETECGGRCRRFGPFPAFEFCRHLLFISLFRGLLFPPFGGASAE